MEEVKENLYELMMTEKQVNKLISLLDLILKLRGIEVLTDTVDLYNIIASAKKLEQPVESEVIEKPDISLPTPPSPPDVPLTTQETVKTFKEALQKTVENFDKEQEDEEWKVVSLTPPDFTG